MLYKKDVYISDYWYGLVTNVNEIKIINKISMKVKGINKIWEIITKSNSKATNLVLI